MPPDCSVDICVEVTKQGQRYLEATVATMANVLREHRVTGSAILLVTWPSEKGVTSAMQKFEMGLSLQSETVANGGRPQGCPVAPSFRGGHVI